MADFSQFLKKPAGGHKRPPILPPDDYFGVVKGWQPGESRNKKTPYARVFLGLTAWGQKVPDQWQAFDKASQSNVTVSKSDIDLGKRQLYKDFYATDDALYILDEFLASCGIQSSGDQPYEEILPQLVGAQVMVEVQQYMNERTQEPANQVGGVVGIR